MFRFVWNSGVLLAATMAFLFSIDSVATASVSKTVPIFEYTVASGVIKVAVTLVINKASRESLFGRREDLHLLLPTGFCFGGFLICFYGSVGLLPLVDAIGLFYMQPVFCAIFGRLAFKDPFGLPSVLGLVLVVWGVGLVNGSSFLFVLKDVRWDSKRIIGTALGACSALLTAVAFSAARGLDGRVSAGTIGTWAFTFQTVLAIPPMLVGYPSRPVAPGDVYVIVLTVIAALSSSVGDIFACQACQRIPVGLATSIETSHLIWGLLWSTLFLGHATTWEEGLGIVLIIFGAISVGMDGPMKSTVIGWFRSVNLRRQKQDAGKEVQSQLAEEQAPLINPSIEDDP